MKFTIWLHLSGHHLNMEVYMEANTQNFENLITSRLLNLIGGDLTKSDVNIRVTPIDAYKHEVRIGIKLKKGQIGVVRSGFLSEHLMNSICIELHQKYLSYLDQARKDLFKFENTDEHDLYSELSLLTEPQRKYTALILEDDPVASKVLEQSLCKMGVNSKILHDPDSALKYLKVNDIDIMFLDWNLPYYNGEVFLTKADFILQEKKLSHKIPLVICTSHLESEMKIPFVYNFKLEEVWNKAFPFSNIFSSMEVVLKREKLFIT